MLLRGRKHLFSIRSINLSSDPQSFEECVARIWAHMWPHCRYPRYEHLTPEQRHFCFGPMARNGLDRNHHKAVSIPYDRR
jgi:hypothetical protein